MAIKLGGSHNGGTGALHKPVQTQVDAIQDIVPDSALTQPAPAVVKTVAPAPAKPATVPTPVHREMGRKKEAVNHPEHYGGKENTYEVIKVIRAWNLNFSLGNTVKYIARAGKKDPMKKIEDLHKAMWYLQEEINSEYEKIKQ
jgi:Protein of unknwon function (DUF3310)